VYLLSNLQTNVEAHLSFLLHFSFLCLPALASKVPCCRVVELARAEVSGNPRPNAAVKRFAKIPVEDAEAGCHELFRELGLCAPVKVEYPTMDGMKSIPYIRISSWAQWLLDTNRLWRQFVGVGSWERMQVVLGEYWARFRELYPNHEVFTLPCDLKRTIPFYSHSDEGRTYKSKPIYVLSVHGALGRGTSSYVRKQKHKAELSKLQMGLNFIGNTWATHMMFTSVVRQFMNERTDCLDILLDIFASDCEKLITEGVTSSDGTKTVFMLHIATKGDLPALAKVGGLTRTFSHVCKASSSRTASKGICHYCKAGQERNEHGQVDCPFEDFSLQPSWLPTMHTSDPWLREPTLLRGIPLDRSSRAQFFETDIWHNMHLGCLKHWVACAFVSLIERLGLAPLQGSVEAKFSWLTSDFKAFCRTRKISPYLSEISRATMAFPMSSACPLGQWSKGVVSTHFCQYLETLCDRYGVGESDDVVLCAIVI